jgi:pimeloyl-ACP methyl ester carboxylesterase
VEEASGSSPSGSTRIAWRALGGGDPLVLVNGYAATKTDWDPAFLERLAGGGRVVCIDNRGTGDSAAGDEEIEIEQLAADVIAVMNDLGIDRAPVVGWSMGGFIVQTLAAREPERVEAAVLIGTNQGGGKVTKSDPEVFRSLIDHSGTPEEQASRLIRLLFPEPVASQVEREFGAEVAAARAALDHATLSAQEAVMLAWGRSESEERLRSIADARIPVLCAHGARDVVIPAANTDTLAAALPGSWKAVFPGAGHAVMAMEPERLATLIGTFLDRK